MPITLPPTANLDHESVFAQGRREGGHMRYHALNLGVPFPLSPWDACAVFMERGYLPPFELVRQLHEEEVEYGEVAKRLWVLRGARRTAQLVRESAMLELRQVHELKKVVLSWRPTRLE